MKVLILGGTGAIGSYLVNILSENHIDTTVTKEDSMIIYHT